MASDKVIGGEHVPVHPCDLVAEVLDGTSKLA